MELKSSLCFIIISCVHSMINGQMFGSPNFFRSVQWNSQSSHIPRISTKVGILPLSTSNTDFAKSYGFPELDAFNDGFGGFGGFTGTEDGFNNIGGFPGVSPFDRSFLKFGSFPSFNGLKGFGGIWRNMEEAMKSMKIAQDRSNMQSGSGGITIVQSPGKTLIKKDGATLECLGQISRQKPFCQGQLRRFQIHTRQDYCYSERYTHQGNVVCIGHNDQNGISFVNNNGHYMCSGSDERPTLLITLQEYQRMCGKLPWDTTFHYFPDPTHPFRVHLPNRDLGCTRSDVCVFRVTPKSSI